MKYMVFALLCAASGGVNGQPREHAETSIVLQLPAPPATVFPLFGPVREAEWSPHWNPQILYPPDRRQVAGSVLVTGHGQDAAVWLMDVYDESALRISYVIVRAGNSATKVDIVLEAKHGNRTQATVTYRLTALSEEGDRYVRQFAGNFPAQRNHWEQAISRRLGELAPSH